MATVESYILHAYKSIAEPELVSIAQTLKAEKIVKDEAVKMEHLENKHPHVYHFILDGSSKQ